MLCPYLGQMNREQGRVSDLLYKEKNEDSYVSVNNLISPRNKDEKIGVSFPLQGIHMESIYSKGEAGPEAKLFANEITEQEPSMEMAQSDTSEVDGPKKKIVNGLTEKMDLGSGRRLDSSKKKEYSGTLVSTGGYTIEEIIRNLEQLERLALLYQQKTGNDTPVNELILQYIRRSKYNTGNWPAVAGKSDSSFVAFVDSHNTEVSNYFHENIIFHDPLTGNEVDLLHLIAALNGLIHEITWRDAGISSLVGKALINNLVGWAGDLQTLVIDVIKVVQNSNDYNVLYEAAVLEERNRREENLDDVPLLSLQDIAEWGAVLRNKPQMMTGEDVKELQTILKYFGYEVDVDGVFGPQTEEAVKEFQKDSDLKADGVVGYNTRQKLQKALAINAIRKGAPVFSIEVKRIQENELTTLGELYVQDEKMGYTLELAWKDNQTSKSRIKPGEYYAFFRTESRIELIDVPGRSHIQIHKGNRRKDTEGCILPGKSFFMETVDGEKDERIHTHIVEHSKETLDKIIARYHKDGGIIKVIVSDHFKPRVYVIIPDMMIR